MGKLTHADLWQELWTNWVLLGDSIFVLWVPLHVVVMGNEGSGLANRTGGSGLITGSPDIQAGQGSPPPLQKHEHEARCTILDEERAAFVVLVGFIVDLVP